MLAAPNKLVPLLIGRLRVGSVDEHVLNVTLQVDLWECLGIDVSIADPRLYIGTPVGMLVDLQLELRVLIMVVG